MDKRWKQLTAPLWAELAEWSYLGLCEYPDYTGKTRSSYMWMHESDDRVGEYVEAFTEPREKPDGYLAILHKLLELRRARLAGECPVMWKLSRP